MHWVSIDPRNANVVFYPERETELIEGAYRARREEYDTEVYLGLQFFAATVRLGEDGTFSQTTPGDYVYSCKMPGFRSVLRVENLPVEIGVRRIHGEWRHSDVDKAEKVIKVS